ncbi:MAG TPA: hypothetical protein PL124_10680 [Candidatus Cloacimonadota bacterium]|nr:hypothetical protein [Candidatus Cloacimonadota bacterium]
MAAYSTLNELKAAITAAIYENSLGLITATVLEDLLQDLVDTLDSLGGSSGSFGQYTIWTSGAYSFRQGIRGGEFVLDQTITVTGFAGTENIDWANIRSEVLPS